MSLALAIKRTVRFYGPSLHEMNIAVMGIFIGAQYYGSNHELRDCWIFLIAEAIFAMTMEWAGVTRSQLYRLPATG